MLESILDNEYAVNATLIRIGNREQQITGMEKKLLYDLLNANFLAAIPKLNNYGQCYRYARNS